MAPHEPTAAAVMVEQATEEAGKAPVDDLAEGGFTAQLWQSVEGTLFQSIIAHPFLTGMVDGTLPEDAFRFYLVQDALYLREYGRALALVASRAPRTEWTQFFLQCSRDAYSAESTFHTEFLAYYGTTPKAELVGAVRSPNNMLYTSFLLQTIHERAFYEGLAAVLPCFVVYLEVGKALKQKGSRHPLYSKWVEKYGGEEFEDIVRRVVQLTDEVALELGAAQRARMQQLFVQGCRMEWLFWDAAFHKQQWPI